MEIRWNTVMLILSKNYNQLYSFNEINVGHSYQNMILLVPESNLAESDFINIKVGYSTEINDFVSVEMKPYTEIQSDINGIEQKIQTYYYIPKVCKPDIKLLATLKLREII